MFDYYRPRSVASEGYVFTGVCHSFCSTLGGEVVNTKGPGYNTSLPPQDETRLQHLPPRMRPDYNTSLPPSRMRPGYNTSLPPRWDQVTTPPPPGPGHGSWSQHLPPPPPRDYAQAGGTHPTGMHPCFKFKCFSLKRFQCKYHFLFEEKICHIYFI